MPGTRSRVLVRFFFIAFILNVFSALFLIFAGGLARANQAVLCGSTRQDNSDWLVPAAQEKKKYISKFNWRIEI